MLYQMVDELAEDQELSSHQYTENSPHGRQEKKRSRGTADVWKTVKQLANVVLMGKMLREEHGREVYEFSHVCVLCWRHLKMRWDNGTQHWTTNNTLDHLETEHEKNSVST